MSTDETPVVAPGTKKSKTAAIPSTDQSLSGHSVIVAETWALKPDITLRWTTPADFAATVNRFKTSLGERLTTGGGRAAVTNEMKSLDVTINKNLDYIKGYLKDKYGKENYTSYFPQFGITVRGNNYIFPNDRDKRLAALKLTIEALTANGLQDMKYGLAFWQDILSRYETALKLSIITDSNVAGLVSTKNEHRKLIRKTLNALVHSIKANYPDTYASVLREWGFQKEKY
jgi:hypothetical protein